MAKKIIAKTKKKKVPKIPITDMSQVDRVKIRKSAKTLAIGGARRGFSYCDMNKLKFHEQTSDKKGVRGGKRFDCECCGNDFGQADCRIDHIDPIVPLNVTQAEMGLDLYLDRLVCEYDNLQLLCVDCHNTKSNAERAERARFRKERWAKQQLELGEVDA